MRTDDFIVTIAYFSIPIQILVSLYRYPRLHSMPWTILVLVILFALFVFLCGAGHLLKCLGMGETKAFIVVNAITAIISLSTALYLLPITPFLMSSLDHNIQELVKLNEETEDSKRKLMTFMAFLCHEIRNPLFIITSTISFLEENPDDIEASGSMSLIKQSADLMLRLVNDVLDISRLESGKLELEKHDFDLHQTIEGATTSARAHIRERHGKNTEGDNGEPVVGFRSHVDPEVPRLVHGDQVRVLQVCLNLLSNAVKFTESGFIDFRVSVCDYEDSLLNDHISDCSSTAMDFVMSSAPSEDVTDDATLLLDEAESGKKDKSRRSLSNPDLTVLKIRVEDTGCGIPAEQTSRIFRPYCMAKLSEYRQYGGTGLGLAIVSKLASIMNGSITVRSSVGIGSVFEAYLVVERASLSASFEMSDNISLSSTSIEALDPLPQLPTGFSNSQHIESSQNVIRVAPKRSASLPRMTITKFDYPTGEAVVLVVDDNSMNRKLLTRMLKSFGLECQEACNGQEAIDVMLRSRNKTGDKRDPQIVFVLMDLSMPVMGGCEATRLIRQYGMEVPIMALTAAAIEEGREGAMAAGVTDFGTKPILRDELNLKCVRFISQTHPPYAKLELLT
ncbi:PAS domain containing protein [Nitzschia inconspicua]|uniref:histidine kinase n=1 Tax=Nitzschia inconspicua TaxID=303405 RepID=A0A9K3K6M1_9STRA|nr:PAS domain containing protein [Nitzschia inconspicua]KAG7348278.1 PAS domain containing protein [Nitzschia inconspicua]